MKVPNDFLYLLSLHKKANDSIINKASRLCRDDIEFATEREIIRIRRMVNSVLNEIHLMRGFVRLTPLGDLVLYGYMKPGHDVGTQICQRIAKRNSGMIIILGNNSESWISLHDGRKAMNSKAGPLEQTVGELKAMTNCKEDDTIEKIWETYYWSQFCEDRRNPRYFNRNMPKKHRKSAGLRVERNNHTTIDDFC